MCITLIGKLAIQERHRRASLWVQQSISETKDLPAVTPNLDTVTSPVASSQYQPISENPSPLVASQSPPTVISPQHQNQAMAVSPVASSQYQPISENPSPLVAPQSPPTAIFSPQNQSQAMVTSPVASSQYQPNTENPLPLVASQSPPTAIISPQIQNQAMVTSPVASLHYQPITANPSPLVASQSPFTAIISPQNQNQAMVASPVASSQYQPITANPSPLVASQSPPTAIITPQNQNQPMVTGPVVSSQYVGSQYSPTAFINPEVQTTPSVLNIQQQTFDFLDPTISLSGSAQPPRADSPMTQFLNSTSGVDNWGGDNGMSMSSDLFNFSGMNSFSVPSSDPGPPFGMDQHWKTNTLGSNMNASATSLLDPIAPTSFMFSNDTTALPTSAPPTSTTTDGFIPANSTVALKTATNTLRVSDGTAQYSTDGKSKEVDDNSKKRQTYEERNAHCILPEGTRRPRKSRRIEGAEEENTAGPAKKRNTNTNKKGKGSKGKK
jgi:hypothetical protein